MEEPNRPQKIFAGTPFFRCLVLSLLSGILFCSGFFFLPFGMVGYLFAPTPLALLGVRENRGWMTAGLLVMGLSLYLLLGPMLSISFLLMNGLLCCGLTLPPGRVKKGTEALLFCTTVSIVAKVMLMAVNIVLINHNPFVMEPDAMRGAIMQMYTGLLPQDTQSAAVLKESMEQMITLASYMVPSMILVWSMLDSFLNYRLCEALQRRSNPVFPPLPPFRAWRFPKNILWPLFVAFLLPLLFTTDTWPLGIMLEINLKFLVGVFFFLQGLSLVWWWLEKRRVHFVLRVLIVSLLTLPILGLWVIALGVGDICFDFRTLGKRVGKKT
jgi:uncharacterized protein YybS (DUF2232 family)